MGMLQEFKEFAVKGNMVDMAVGIVVGAGFGKIVASFVNDVMMPPLAILTGGVDFKDKLVTLKKGIEAVGDVPAVKAITLNYGNFVQSVTDFVIIAFAVFLLVKAINSLKRKEETKPAAPPAPTKQEELLCEIRDLLKQRA